MKPGDFVKVDYVGRIKETGKIFDLTKEDVAKEEDVYNPKSNYGPVTLILGSGLLINGLDEAIQKMKVGAKEEVEIPPEKGFGKRKENLIKMISKSKFKDQELDPYPGAVINVGNMKGKILSVGGGRVKVDFNHPLAGKILKYDIEIKSIVKDKNEKIKAVVGYFTGVTDDIKVESSKEEAEIIIKKDVDIVRQLKKMIAENVIKWCDVDKVKISEVFEKDNDDAEEEETKGK